MSRKRGRRAATDDRQSTTTSNGDESSSSSSSSRIDVNLKNKGRSNSIVVISVVVILIIIVFPIAISTVNRVYLKQQDASDLQNASLPYVYRRGLVSSDINYQQILTVCMLVYTLTSLS